MTINTKTVLNDTKGEPIKNGDDLLTVKEVIGNALAIGKTTDPWKSFLLSKKFFENDSVDLKSEEVVFIKTILKESNYIPFVIGQVINVLEDLK